MRITAKLILGFTSVAALVAVVGILARLANEHVRTDMTLCSGSMQELVGAADMKVELERVQLVAQDLLIEKLSPDGVEPRELVEAEEKMAESLDRFEAALKRSRRATQLAADGGEVILEGRHPLERVSRDLVVYRGFVNAFLTAVREAERSDAARMEESLVRHYRQRLLPVIDDYAQYTADKLNRDVNGILRTLDNGNTYISRVTVAGLLCSLLLGFVTSRVIVGPISRLVAATRELGSGRLDTRIEITATDELGTLADSFNDMANRLQESTVSRAYMDDIIQSMSEMLFVLDTRGRIVAVNRATSENLGYSGDELIGRDVDFVFATTTPGGYSAGSGCGHDERRLRTHDDAEINVVWSEAKLHSGDDEPAGIVCVALNTEDLRRAEAVSRQMAALVESARDAIIGMNADGEIESVNRAAELLFGYESRNLVGRPLSILCSADEWSDLSESLNAVHEGNVIDTRETTCRRNDGSMVPVSLSLSPIRDEHGRVSGLAAIVRNMTRRLEFEEELRRSLRQKEVLLREVHHRVKNNLQIVTSLLSLQAGRARHAETLDVVEESQAQIQAMALIHEHLYREDDMESVDYADYLEHLCQKLVETGLGGDDFADGTRRIHIAADSVRLGVDQAIPCGMIVSELVGNSIKHAFPDRPPGRIDVAFRNGAGECELSVRDDGVGFPVDFVLENSDSLGLKLVSALVQQIGGRLRIETGPGGSVSVAFPGSDAESAESAPVETTSRTTNDAYNARQRG